MIYGEVAHHLSGVTDEHVVIYFKVSLPSGKETPSEIWRKDSYLLQYSSRSVFRWALQRYPYAYF